MSADTNNPHVELAAADPTAPTAATAAAAAAAASAGPKGTPADMQKISSMDDLKRKSPELYKLIMQGIGTTIVNEMREHQEKIKQMMREAQRDAERR